MALQLALGDFEELIFEKVFVLESHPQVKITVIPDIVGGSIPLKYAVWGLNIGIGMSFQGLPFFFGAQLPNRGIHPLLSRARNRLHHVQLSRSD